MKTRTFLSSVVLLATGILNVAICQAVNLNEVDFEFRKVKGRVVDGDTQKEKPRKDNPPEVYSKDFLRAILRENIESPEHALPCMKCGRKGEDLVWKKISCDLTSPSPFRLYTEYLYDLTYRHEGVLSYCEHCESIVEFSLYEAGYNTQHQDTISLNNCKQNFYQSMLAENVFGAAYNLGSLAQLRGDWKLAEDFFQKEVDLYDDFSAKMNLALSWVVQGDYKSAIDYVKTVCEGDSLVMQRLNAVDTTQGLVAIRQKLVNVIGKADFVYRDKIGDSYAVNTGIIPLHPTENNVFSQFGKRYIKFISSRKQKYDGQQMLEILDKISLPSNCRLECNTGGEFSAVGVLEEVDGVRKWVRDYWKCISIEPSEMSIWQAFLLINSRHAMPYKWHGAYNRREYVFSINDLMAFPNVYIYDIQRLYSDGLILPSVTIKTVTPTETIAEIQCTYWTMWGGLVRETCDMHLEGNQIKSLSITDLRCLIYYDCGAII